MAQSPIPRPDRVDSRESSAGPTPLEAGERSEPEAGLSLAQWVRSLSTHGGGFPSTELALDLVLNEIVQRACTATGASSAAIALERQGEMVCRATTGESAPDLGSRLNTDSGLSAACVNAREWQSCDDTEADSRVNPELCRRLGVRSILVVPILKGEELLGVVEIFSSRPGAFKDPQILALQKLSRDVVENVGLAVELSAEPLPQRAAVAVEATAEAVEPAVLETPGREAAVSETPIPETLAPESSDRNLGKSDLWTGVLLLAVVVLALILGWAIGRTAWKKASTNPAAQKAQAVQDRAPASGAGTMASIDSKVADGKGGRAGAGGASGGSDLVVYKDGKVVFQLPSQSSAGPAGIPPAVPAQPAVKEGDTSSAFPVRISPQIAAEYLTTRVEPEYPKPAREGHIQGPVVLDAVVGKDGVVQSLKSIGGDPQLAAAATDAVRQWRFRPFFRSGHPEEFRTQITVVFRLP